MANGDALGFVKMNDDLREKLTHIQELHNAATFRTTAEREAVLMSLRAIESNPANMPKETDRLRSFQQAFMSHIQGLGTQKVGLITEILAYIFDDRIAPTDPRPASSPAVGEDWEERYRRLYSAIMSIDGTAFGNVGVEQAQNQTIGDLIARLKGLDPLNVTRAVDTLTRRPPEQAAARVELPGAIHHPSYSYPSHQTPVFF